MEWQAVAERYALNMDSLKTLLLTKQSCMDGGRTGAIFTSREFENTYRCRKINCKFKYEIKKRKEDDFFSNGMY
jgi:hypothetical protein